MHDPDSISPDAISPDAISRAPLATVLSDDPKSFAEIVDTWLLAYALNAVNRSMGKGDLSPSTSPPRYWTNSASCTTQQVAVPEGERPHLRPVGAGTAT